MQSKRKCSAIFLLFLFATIGSSNSKTNSRKNLKRKIQKVVSGSEGLLSSNQKQRRRQLQTNETVAPAKEYDTTKLDKDGNPTVNDGSSSTAKEQKKSDGSSSTPEERKRLREQEISVLRERLKKKTNFATPHGHNQKVLEMYKLRGGGDAVSAILKTVEAENKIHLSQSIDSPEPSTSSGGAKKCDTPKNPDEEPSCCSCEGETPSCTDDMVPQHSAEIPCECNPNGGYKCVPPRGAQKGKSDDDEKDKGKSDDVEKHKGKSDEVEKHKGKSDVEKHKGKSDVEKHKGNNAAVVGSKDGVGA